MPLARDDQICENQRRGLVRDADAPLSLASPHAFAQLWQAASPRSLCADHVAKVTDALMAQYSDPSRHYHGISHVDFCLSQLEPARPLFGNVVAGELALWFHDVIYDPTRGDNEARSAEFFSTWARDALPGPLVDQVNKLILMTDYPSAPKDNDARLLVDIDMSSFGRPWPEYLRDSLDVRREAVHLSDDEFYARQLRFLESQLRREAFCYTRFFQARHGQRAMDNMRKLVRLLRARPNCHAIDI